VGQSLSRRGVCLPKPFLGVALQRNNLCGFLQLGFLRTNSRERKLRGCQAASLKTGSEYHDIRVSGPFVGLSGHIFVVSRFPSKSGLIHKHIVKHMT
jgi:hypothetical protein